MLDWMPPSSIFPCDLPGQGRVLLHYSPPARRMARRRCHCQGCYERVLVGNGQWGGLGYCALSCPGYVSAPADIVVQEAESTRNTERETCGGPVQFKAQMDGAGIDGDGEQTGVYPKEPLNTSA